MALWANRISCRQYCRCFLWCRRGNLIGLGVCALHAYVPPRCIGVGCKTCMGCRYVTCIQPANVHAAEICPEIHTFCNTTDEPSVPETFMYRHLVYQKDYMLQNTHLFCGLGVPGEGHPGSYRITYTQKYTEVVFRSTSNPLYYIYKPLHFSPEY